MAEQQTADDGTDPKPDPYDVLEQLDTCETARIALPGAWEETHLRWIPVEPILVDRTGWSAVVRQRNAAPEDSPNIRAYKLETAGKQSDGTHRLEVYHLCERYGSTYIGDLQDIEVED